MVWTTPNCHSEFGPVMQPSGNLLHLLIFTFSTLYLLCLKVSFVGEREESGMLGGDDKKGAKSERRAGGIKMERFYLMIWTELTRVRKFS